MHLALTERQIGAVTVLDLVGKLDRPHAQRLKDKINSLIQQGRTEIVLNLTDVSYIDSGGLGQLVASYGSVAKTSGGLKLLGVSKRNHDLLSITRLVHADAYDSEKEAVESFRTHVTSPAVAAIAEYAPPSPFDPGAHSVPIDDPALPHRSRWPPRAVPVSAVICATVLYPDLVAHSFSLYSE